MPSSLRYHSCRNITICQWLDSHHPVSRNDRNSSHTSATGPNPDESVCQSLVPLPRSSEVTGCRTLGLQRTRRLQAKYASAELCVYYYDCRPFGEKVKDHTGKIDVDFSKSKLSIKKTHYLNDVCRLDKFAVRLGELSFNGWKQDLHNQKNGSQTLSKKALT